MNKNVLITGGAGFIGSNLSKFLLSNNYNVICLDNFQTGKKNNIECLLSNDRFKLIEHDIGIMADWIERAGYGVDMNRLKEIQLDLGIIPTSLENWLKAKLCKEIQFNKSNITENRLNYNWERSKLKLELDKQ